MFELHSISSQEEVTPEKSSDANYDEIMRTPRLEDFGLSEALLSKYSSYAASTKQSQNIANNGKSERYVLK